MSSSSRVAAAPVQIVATTAVTTTRAAASPRPAAAPAPAAVASLGSSCSLYHALLLLLRGAGERACGGTKGAARAPA